jgi:hypothetical protein
MALRGWSWDAAIGPAGQGDRPLLEALPELYNGNRESLWEQLCTGESLFLRLLRTHHRRRREYPMMLTWPEYAHLRVERFRRPREYRPIGRLLLYR